MSSVGCPTKTNPPTASSKRLPLKDVPGRSVSARSLPECPPIAAANSSADVEGGAAADGFELTPGVCHGSSAYGLFANRGCAWGVLWHRGQFVQHEEKWHVS